MKRTILIGACAILGLALGGCGDDTTDSATPMQAATAPWTDIGENLSIAEPRVRLLPGGGPAAGYMRLRNGGAETVRITGAASPAFGHAMMHRSMEREGEWSMRPVDGALGIAPGETLVFEPQGLHLMLMHPQKRLQPGDGVTITLQFADGPTREVAFNTVGIMEESR